MRRCVLRKRAEALRDARGAAAVEFALILPILLVLVFGIINYGDMLSVRQSVSQAASEGARAAAVDPGTDVVKIAAAKKAVDAALDAQKQKCSAWGPEAGKCNVTIAACAGEASKRCATVKVVIAFKAIIPGFDLVLPDNLSYTAVARVS